MFNECRKKSGCLNNIVGWLLPFFLGQRFLCILTSFVFFVEFCFLPSKNHLRPNVFLNIPLRELSHAAWRDLTHTPLIAQCDLSHVQLAGARVNSRRLIGGLSSRTHIFWTVVSFFTSFLHVFFYQFYMFFYYIYCIYNLCYHSNL